jgi:hypothetical protein
MPTRLLDWTSDIFVALYFASIGGWSKIRKNDVGQNESITIWALDAHHINYLEQTVDRTQLKLVVPKYSTNPNLNAQKGILSYWEIIHEPLVYLVRKNIGKNSPDSFPAMDEYENKPVDRTALDKLLHNELSCSKGNKVILYKFEIPILEAIPAFEYIMKIGYTAGKLFPGYAGITKEIEEVTLFYRTKESIKT